LKKAETFPHEVIRTRSLIQDLFLGIDESTALTAITERIRRGGAYASTPDSFNVE